MSSSTIIVIAVFCILNNWFAIRVCSTLGMQDYRWMACLLPSFIVYNVCDKRKLRRAASGLCRCGKDLETLLKALTVGLIVLSGLHFRVVPWIISAITVSVYLVSAAFSNEKMLYMCERCSTMAKQFFRAIISNFRSETTIMRMKGDWSFCSPYSRKLVVVSTDHYFTLKRGVDNPPPGSPYEPVEFSVAFQIENCQIACRHSYLSESWGEKRWSVNQVEVSLIYVNEMLEEYTYDCVPWDRVAELGCLLKVLEEEGNLVLSSFHRYVDSEDNLAHARCYEFKEMMDLVVKKGWKLRKVCLAAKYDCSISGSSCSHGLFAGLALGLFFCEVSGGPGHILQTSAPFSVFLLLLASMELDMTGLFSKAQRGLHTLLIPSLRAFSLRLFRATVVCVAVVHS